METIHGATVISPDPGGAAPEAVRGPMTLGPETTEGAYVAMVGAMPAVGADNGGGTIARIDEMGTPTAMAAQSDCAPVGAATPAA